ncbi:2-amino-4-hydroxy-6-hydroxymethyldihydropteridine diphosphokinase [Loktanella sp. IMCC34160]|uniref:2-amino-4-hydroxy-6- hydroxymethyldihydropteridine diphosphokinase n=1 Tax=Loktanella sp. IMCC34160 TaxID=2510646 RepID=UPI00101DA84D|nr:2-amino-4-hydroxy-6-hydroxymethyldihydropteridine diphosphokinase [Loktanella sp. IMCC34160]RYG91631.1 2-amino-4-hydroxy-6-hydroxymethyldihydropteridine diphosphokinase [Loktanella sp. IMCC34160]
MSACSKGQFSLIALGGNVTSNEITPEKRLLLAMDRIAETVGDITDQSAIYRTPCFPAGAGPDYANAVIRVRTDLEPADILTRLHEIEAAFGRERVQRWGERTLDLDLLAVGDAVLPDRATWDHWAGLPLDDQKVAAPDQLILPHPRIQDRAFVLVPLCDVAPDWTHPVLGKTAADMCAALPAEQRAEVVAL